jgi:erythromycin esterase
MRSVGFPILAALAVACREPTRTGTHTTGSATSGAAISLRPHPLSLHASYAATDLAFLRDAIGTRSIVQLGESIHITDELPRARLSIVRFLHEELGFDVIAFEGSAIEAWLAEDGIYRSTDEPAVTARRAQTTAWFALWDTEPMLEVMTYVVASHATDAPLYLASFDLQPGNTKPFSGHASAAIEALLDAIAAYAPRPAGSWASTMAPALDCWKADPPAAAREAAARAIDQLDGWIVAAASAVAAKTSKAHASALARIPAMLRARLDMCAEVAAASEKRTRVYQEARDRQNAKLAIALRDEVSAAHRVILWAHHSHVNHNTLGTNIPSMGQHLHEALPDALYTIGLFAGSGAAMGVEDGACPPIQPRALAPLDKLGAETLLAHATTGDFFVDLHALDRTDASLAAWFSPTTSRLEATGQMPTILARDFDGAVFVREVHPVELQSVPAAMRAMMALKCAAGGTVN